MSKGRAGKRHVTMLLNGLHVNTFSRALKMSFVLRVGHQKERGKGSRWAGQLEALVPLVGENGTGSPCSGTRAEGPSLNWNCPEVGGHVLPH